MTKSGEKMEKAEWRFPRWRRDAVGRCDEEGSPQARDTQRPDEKAHMWVYVQNDEDGGSVDVSVSTANDIGNADDFEVTLYAGGRSHDFGWYKQFLFADNPPITSNANGTPSITHEQVTAVSARVGNRALNIAGGEWWWLDLGREWYLTALRAADFDGLTGLTTLRLNYNRLTTLPAGVFDGLTSLQTLTLQENQLTTLPDGVFDGLTSLQTLWLGELTTLPAGVFDSLTRLLTLGVGVRTTLPAGVFDSLTRLRWLDLRENHLVGVSRWDPVFAGLSIHVDIRLSGQTEPPDTRTADPTRLAAAVPLMLSASYSTRQGFVRVVNESGESGAVRVFAFDDGGHAPDPIEIRLGAGRVVHFNSNDLEDGNPNKGIESGVGGPVQGDWRLDVETSLAVRVLAFVRHGDGFLTAMHDVLSRDADGRLVAHTFNPGGNMNQASSLRLVNTGESDENVSIEGVDDQGGAGDVDAARGRIPHPVGVRS